MKKLQLRTSLPLKWLLAELAERDDMSLSGWVELQLQQTLKQGLPQMLYTEDVINMLRRADQRLVLYIEDALVKKADRMAQNYHMSRSMFFNLCMLAGMAEGH